MKYKEKLSQIIKKDCETRNVTTVINWLFDKEVINSVGIKRFVVYNDFLDCLRQTKEDKNLTISEIVNKLSHRHSISKRYVQYIYNRYAEL